MIDPDWKLPKGSIVVDKSGAEWIYIGGRKTNVETIERIFCRVVSGNWPNCLWTYKATRAETIKEKFGI